MTWEVQYLTPGGFVGQPNWNYTNIQNLIYLNDLSVLASITEGSGRITQLNDLSSNAWHIAKASGGPYKQLTGISGKESVYFSVSPSTWLSRSGISINVSTLTVMIAGVLPAITSQVNNDASFISLKASADSDDISSVASLAPIKRVGSGTQYVVRRGAVQSAPLNIQPGEFFTLVIRFTGVSMLIRVNGVDIQELPSTGSFNITEIGVGARHSGANGSTWRMGVLAISNLASPTSDVERFEGKAHHYYSDGRKLPKTHPYRLASPGPFIASPPPPPPGVAPVRITARMSSQPYYEASNAFYPAEYNEPTGNQWAGVYLQVNGVDFGSPVYVNKNFNTGEWGEFTWDVNIPRADVANVGIRFFNDWGKVPYNPATDRNLALDWIEVDTGYYPVKKQYSAAQYTNMSVSPPTVGAAGNIAYTNGKYTWDVATDLAAALPGLTPWLPNDATDIGSDLYAWLEFDDLGHITKDGSNLVASISDIDDGSPAWTQSNAANKPTWSATAFNGKEGLVYNTAGGIKQLTATLSALVTNQVTFFALLQMANTSNDSARILSMTQTGQPNDYNNVGSGAFQRTGTSQSFTFYRNNQAFGPISFTYEQPVLAVFKFDPTKGYFAKNGYAFDAGVNLATPGNFNISGWNIGYGANMVVRAIVIVKKALTEPVYQKMSAYLLHKANLQALLPSDSIYLVNPPRNGSLPSPPPPPPPTTVVSPPVYPNPRVIRSGAGLQYDGGALKTYGPHIKPFLAYSAGYNLTSKSYFLAQLPVIAQNFNHITLDITPGEYQYWDSFDQCWPLIDEIMEAGIEYGLFVTLNYAVKGDPGGAAAGDAGWPDNYKPVHNTSLVLWKKFWQAAGLRYRQHGHVFYRLWDSILSDTGFTPHQALFNEIITSFRDTGNMGTVIIGGSRLGRDLRNLNVSPIIDSASNWMPSYAEPDTGESQNYTVLTNVSGIGQLDAAYPMGFFHLTFEEDLTQPPNSAPQFYKTFIEGTVGVVGDIVSWDTWHTDETNPLLESGYPQQNQGPSYSAYAGYIFGFTPSSLVRPQEGGVVSPPPPPPPPPVLPPPPPPVLPPPPPPPPPVNTLTIVDLCNENRPPLAPLNRNTLPRFLQYPDPIRKMYVSQYTGSTNNPGTESRPYLTIAQAIAAARNAGPGTAIEVMNGKYNEDIRIPFAGAAGAYFHLVNYQDHRPEVSSISWATTHMTAGCAYWVHRGFKHNASRLGKRMQDGSIHYTYDSFKNWCLSHNPSTCRSDGSNCGSAMYIEGSAAQPVHHILVDDCIFIDAPGAGLQTSTTDWIVVQRCLSARNGNFGYYGFSNYSSFYPKAVETGEEQALRNQRIIFRWNIGHSAEQLVNSTLINQNYITDGNALILDLGQQYYYPYRTLIHANLFFNNGGSGAHSYATDRCDFWCNTCIGNNRTPRIKAGEIYIGAAQECSAWNNVLVAMEATGRVLSVNNGFGARSQVNSWVGYNQGKNVLFNTTGNYGSGADKTATDIQANPLLVNLTRSPLTIDPRLGVGSPAIGIADLSKIVWPDFFEQVDPGPYDSGAFFIP